MYNCDLRKGMMLLVGVVLAALLGCASTEPYDYQPTAGEMKEGPGVFTGESGEFTVYDSKKGGLFPKKAAPEAEKTTAAAAQAGQEATESPPDAEDFQEFQEFRVAKHGPCQSPGPCSKS